MSWNPYFVHYARAHGRSAEEQLKLDQSRYPGGTGAGFICWISRQKAAFKTKHPEAFIGHAICDHNVWKHWLEQAGNNPCCTESEQDAKPSKVKNKWGQWVPPDGNEGTLARQQVHERYIRSLPVENGMNAVLKTYYGERLMEEEQVMLPEFYDGDPWGDTCPIVLGSNQSLEVLDE